ncbi:hypothetical protein C8F04DRAFT_1100779 [Mycena alexandri]|uniref:Uncharacterized protein n=1 Tax=Mycena alexandri TaxID=1745969 RepID=A0AAD6SXP5_9AGAR|nr:hypothetical protein C8F04DRAFT_1100779 [Mycena alexandri]
MTTNDLPRCLFLQGKPTTLAPPIFSLTFFVHPEFPSKMDDGKCRAFRLSSSYIFWSVFVYQVVPVMPGCTWVIRLWPRLKQRPNNRRPVLVGRRIGQGLGLMVANSRRYPNVGRRSSRRSRFRGVIKFGLPPPPCASRRPTN